MKHCANQSVRTRRHCISKTDEYCDGILIRSCDVHLINCVIFLDNEIVHWTIQMATHSTTFLPHTTHTITITNRDSHTAFTFIQQQLPTPQMTVVELWKPPKVIDRIHLLSTILMYYWHIVRWLHNHRKLCIVTKSYICGIDFRVKMVSFWKYSAISHRKVRLLRTHHTIYHI